MKKKLLTVLAAALIAFGLGACGTPPGPRVNYPITYQINLSNTQVVSNAGPQTTKVSATQEVSVSARDPLYVQVLAPMSVDVIIRERSGGGSGTELGRLSGTSINTVITPRASMLEFSFSVSQANTGGLVQLTISDKPFATTIVQ